MAQGDGRRHCGVLTMRTYRIRIRFANGRRFAFTGIFADGFEAVMQAMADWSDLEIRAISAVRLGVPS